MGVLVLNGCLGFVAFGAYDGTDIEHIGRLIVHIYLRGYAFHIFFGILYCVVVGVAQHLQAVATLADGSPQGDGDRQTRHTGVRNTYGEGVLIDVFTEIDMYLLGLAA